MRRSWLPTEDEECLLRAVLGESGAAVEAWRRWRRSVPLDETGHEAAQLLPLAYRKLTRLGLDDPDLARLKGIYRYAWSQNQLLLRLGENALAALHASGIGTIVLKGAALSVLEYRDLGARPMTDFDVLVPRQRARDAILALRHSGLTPHQAFPDPERRIPVHHSTSMVNELGHELDVHWYALWQSSPDQDLWEAAIPIGIGAVKARALCPADQLMQVCAHGAEWSPTGSLRWIADATVVIRSAGAGLDWRRFSEQVRTRRLTPTILDALEYLRKTYDVPVPPETIADLRGVEVPLIESAARRAARSPANQRRILISQWNRYRRLKKLDPSAPRESSFPAQLKAAWGAPSYRSFSLHAARRLLRIGR